MPHFITEYSANLENVIELSTLFEKVHIFLGNTGVFPLAGIRSRAIRMDTFRVADAKHDYAFIHMTLKVGAGRDLTTRKKIADQLFEIIKKHFAQLQKNRLLAISFEMEELDPILNYKQNNIHAFLEKVKIT